MKKPGLLGKTIPTILGILTLLAGIATGFYFWGKPQLFGPTIPPDVQPKSINISNVTSSGFTVSWLTENPTVGSVIYGTGDKLNLKAIDYRDQQTQETKSYTTHYVNVEGLSASTKYSFKINSGDNNNLYDNGGRPFEVSTGPNLGTQPPTDIIYGKVLTKDKKPAQGAIVNINLAGAASLSSLAGKEGMWARALHIARSQDLKSYLSYDAESSVLTIQATNGTDKGNNATILVSTKNDNPVPDIVLGQDHDYRAGRAETTAKPTLPQQLTSQPEGTASAAAATPAVNFSTLIESEATLAAKLKLTIINPATDGEKINTTKPQIIGQGPANKMITVKLESPVTYSGNTVIDSQGRWSFTPPADLLPGNHKVTVSTIDENGKLLEVSRNFVVLAAGISQLPAFEATPSATSTPSASPTLPPVSLSPATSSSLPTGSVGPTFALITLGLVFLFIGFWIQLKKTNF